MSPPRLGPLIVAALLGIVCALLAAAPASWLGALLYAASGQRVQLAEARGNWHNGSALLVLRGGADAQGATLAPGRLDWHIALGQIWRGQLQLRLHDAALGAQALRLGAMVRPSSWSVRQLAPWQGQLPASLLQGLGTPWNTLALRGHLELTLHALVLAVADGRAQLRGNAQLDARDVQSRLSLVAPLGSYRVVLRGEGASATLQLTTLDGPLRLQGTGLWNGRQWRFDGRGSAAPSRAAELASLLGLLGEPAGNHVRIAF